MRLVFQFTFYVGYTPLPGAVTLLNWLSYTWHRRSLFIWFDLWPDWSDEWTQV